MAIYTDKTKSVVLDPVVINPTTLNTDKDSTIIGEQELQVATDIVLDNGIVEKYSGTTKVNSDNPGTVVYGLHRAYGLGSEKVAIRLANQTLKSGLSSFGTTVLSNLANAITPFINVNGKAYGTNQTDGIIRYNPSTGEGLKVSVFGPFLRKKIAFFENDETWSTSGGGSQSAEYYRADEWTGNAIQSLKLPVSTPGGSCNASATLNLDLSQFDNAKPSDDDDFISFYTFHLVRDDISHISLSFSTGDATFTNNYTTSVYRNDFTPADYSWTHWKIKKSAFIKTGSPDWSTVKAVRIYLYGATGKTPTIYLDFLHLRIASPRAKELRKQIASFNAAEIWNNVSGISLTTDNEVFVEDFCSRKIVAATAGGSRNYRTVSLDLTKWDDGSTIQTTDEISWWLRTTAKANVTKIKLMLGTSATIYYAYDIAGSWFSGNNRWQECRIKKSAFSAVGGMSSWSSITRVDISATFSDATVVYFDDLRIEPFDSYKQIATCEAAENWTFNNAKITTGDKGVVTPPGALLLLGQGAKMTQSDATVTLSSTLNLTQWDDGSSSSTDDLICFNLYHTFLKKIDYLTVNISTGDATFTNYYTYQIQKTEFATGGLKNNRGKEFQKAKSLFTSVGSPNWSQVKAVKFVLQAKNGGDVIIDDVTMKRKPGVTGRYYYKFCYKFKDIASTFSEESNYVDARGSYISVSLLKSSVDSRVTEKEVYRLGGSYPDTWYRVGVIPNDTESFIDKISEDDLSYGLGNDIPSGNISSVPCANLIYDPQSDRILYWGHFQYANRVYYSNRGYYHVVGETSYREFPGDVTYVVPWHGQIIVFLKYRILRVDGDIATGTAIDLPIASGCASFYGADKVGEGLIAYVGMDNFYLFDGFKSIPIGEHVRNYITAGPEYLSSACLKYYQKERAIYIGLKEYSGSWPSHNNAVLRYHLPTKSWTKLSLNVNVWALFNDKTDDNSLWYGDSYATTGSVIKLGTQTYLYSGSAISSSIKTKWFNVPGHELSFYEIEFKAKGSGDLNIYGYKNLSETTPAFSGTVSLGSNWTTYTVSNPLLKRTMTGDHLMLKFAHSVSGQPFRIKDIVLYSEKTPKRVTINEVSIS